MPHPANAVVLALAAAGLLAVGGCGTPNPIIARDPIAQPPRGYRVECYSSPSLFNAYPTACRPVVPLPPERRVVLKTLY